ncbi:alpha/beta hydrolase [Brachybacterium vulturis]|uniref:Alpha/beta hydrolase n=1 Tax=Brachybacterium vulturis TaxID=2017484 RepID=A0A291GR31_9MICO|nr:alpha/beta hydrolase [Brachybacterium vulturis]ATG52685.1 alpha/beta hydrolase [Brachybacterium vulturis]
MSTDPLLGEGYETHRIDLGVDDEGPLVATLIHREAGSMRQADVPRPPVLLMHGWSDYVLDRGLMEHLGRQGHDVWGLDLRKHGRSLLPGQTATEIDHLSRYDAEIGTSLRIIGRDRPPVLLAHSTGGLTAALWAQRNPGTVAGLALNSPWLEMHLGPVTRALAQVPVRMLAERLRRRPILPTGSDHIARASHRDFGGAYDYDLALKPPGGHPFPAVTLNAIIDGQRRLAAAGPLAIPVLVLHADRSRIGPRFSEQMRRSDSVLNVRTLATAAAALSPQVRIDAVPGARHDVFLSDADARARSIDILDDWLETSFPRVPTMRASAHAEDPCTPLPAPSGEELPDDR